MMSNNVFYKALVIGILVLLLGVAVAPCINVISKEFDPLETNGIQEETTVTFYIFDKTAKSESEIILSSNDFSEFYSKLEELNNMITYYHSSEKTQFLKAEFVDFLDNIDLIPEDTSKNDLIKLINNPIKSRRPLFSVLPQGISNGRGYAFFCNFATWGEGTQLPIIILPRLIPIFLTPIPRVIMRWNAHLGITSCGGLLSGKGFIAEGAQQGTALGFWGIGFSVFLPPVMQYGFIGYALFASATAEVIHPWPPNRPPEISSEKPIDGSINVPVDLSELSFHISDDDSDRMNYTVTTTPNIGTGSGSNVGDGTYTIDVSGLNSNTEYSWYVVVSDSEDTTEETFSFHTAIEAPFVSEPIPLDGDSWVSVDLSELSFRLEDLQGDLMDYTVETVPNIGSGSANGVDNGIYTIDVHNLDYTTDYTWFVNVTDGEYWTRRIFGFKTLPIMVFDPFDEGWMYRKKITIDYNMVDVDFTNFSVIVSLVDSDLRDKAQVDGDDILFMNESGVANRLFHEFEEYDDSNGKLVAWVNVDSLSSNVDTDLYMYYGNSDCDSQQYAYKVWDSDYCGVWHLEDFSDSTFNNNDGINYGTEDCSGKIGGAKKFVGTKHDYIKILDSLSLDITQEITLSAWVQFDTISVRYPPFIIYKRGDINDWLDPYKLGVADYENGAEFRINGELVDGGEVNTGHWYNIVGTFNGELKKLYINGVKITEETDEATIQTSNRHLYIGVDQDSGGMNQFLDGVIDEVKILKESRSAEWISTEYNNQNNPSSFFSVGHEESSP